jgi:hypothetical protein
MASDPPEPLLPDERDWTYEVTDRIESAVDTVRSRTTVPVFRAANTLIYGIVAGIFGGAMVFLLILAFVRFLDVYLPFYPEGRRVWVVYAGLAAIFMGVGLLLWRMRLPKDV